MPLLARQVRGILWARTSEPRAWENGNFPHEVLADLTAKAGEGVSFWQIGSRRDPMLRRIAAALEIVRKQDQIDSIEFRMAARTDLDALGVNLRQTQAKSKDPGIDGLHWEIENLTGPQAVRLAELMSGKDKVTTFSAREVARFIARSITMGHIEISSSDPLSPKTLGALQRHGAVRIIVPKKKLAG